MCDLMCDLAWHQGGAYIHTKMGKLTITASTFDSNYASGTSGSGGAVAVVSEIDVSIDTSVFTWNYAPHAGAVECYNCISIRITS